MTLAFRESWIDLYGINRDRLTATAGADDGRTVTSDWNAGREMRNAVDVRADNDEVVVVDVRVVNAIGVELFPNQANGSFLDLDCVFQWTQPLIERDQELPLCGHARVGF